jgi:hypothetical protein
VSDNIFIELILYMLVYIWNCQYLYCECVVYNVDLSHIIVMIKTGHANFFCHFLTIFLFNHFSSPQQLSINQ